jgi:hypothetical protein
MIFPAPPPFYFMTGPLIALIPPIKTRDKYSSVEFFEKSTTLGTNIQAV